MLSTRSQVLLGVFVPAFVVLFCVDLACGGEGDILKLVNIGDDIALNCSRPDGVYDNYKWWYRNGTLLANWNGVFINDPRYTEGVVHNGDPDSNNIYISNLGINDSATFQCLDFHNKTLQWYYVRVIRCFNCITTYHFNPNKLKVICTLDNYLTRQVRTKNILLKGNKKQSAVIQENTFSFSISSSELNRLHSEFYLQIETESRITCMLSTQPTPPSSSTTTLPTTSFKQTTQNRPSSTSYAASKYVPIGRPTTISQTKHHTPKYKHAKSDKRATMLPRTSLKQTTQNTPSTLSYTTFKTLPVGSPTSIPTTIHHKPTNKTANSDKRTTTLPTTVLKQKTQNRPSTLQYTASTRLPFGRPSSISTTKHHTTTNKNANSDKRTTTLLTTSLKQTMQNRPTSPNPNSDKNKRGVNITMIIVILGSAFILILIVIIIVLRCKQLSDPEYRTSIKGLRESSLDQRRADHPENGEMVDDIVYDSADQIEDSSITRIKGPLDNALYTMPDKRAAISRKPKSTSKVTDRSSNSDHLYGNSVIITQHWQNRDILQQGDQYENVKMPGSGGDAEEIPLYDMPDKGLMWNTLKATPKAGQTSTLPKDDVVSVDALYAKVDKTKKKIKK